MDICERVKDEDPAFIFIIIIIPQSQLYLWGWWQ